MKLQGLKIMVTGGAGFIGSHLVGKLIEMDNYVIIYDNFDEYYLGKEYNIEDYLKNPKCKLVKADILNCDVLHKIMKKVDVVFHLAAQAGVRYSLENPLKTNMVNTSGTINVLSEAVKNNVQKIIFASSSSVYGIPEYSPIDEKHPTNPISVYGASKLAAEKYCQIYNDISNLQTVILRYHTVYGPRQRPDMAIYKWTRGLLQNLPPEIYGNGEQTRDFTYIDDIIDGTLKSAEREDLEKEVINIGSGASVSVKTTIDLLLKATDKQGIEPIYSKPKCGDVPHTHADISKATNLLGYKPKMSLETGIKRFIDWFQSNLL